MSRPALLGIVGASFGLLLQTAGSLAAEPHRLSLYAKRMHALDVVLDDQVENGCLPRPDAIKEAAESEIMRTGMSLDPNSLNYIYVGVLGYSLTRKNGEDTNTCVVYVSTSLKILSILLNPPFDDISNSTTHFVELSSRGTLLVGERDGMQLDIRQNVIESTTSLLLEVFMAANGS